MDDGRGEGASGGGSGCFWSEKRARDRSSSISARRASMVDWVVVFLFSRGAVCVRGTVVGERDSGGFPRREGEVEVVLEAGS